MAEHEVAVEHPNRKKASSKLTKLVVVLLLLASAFLMVLVTVGAWEALVGAKVLQVIYIVLYVVLAFFVARWSRGVLPLIAALAIVLFIFALVSVPGWFERDKDGFTDPSIPSDVVGLITALIVPLQGLLTVSGRGGFQQAGNAKAVHPAFARRHGDAAPVPA